MSDRGTEKAHRGTRIKVGGLMPEKESFEDVFHVVSNHEAHGDEHNVATSSLLGEALIGTNVGDEVVVETKEGPMKLTALELGHTASDT